MDLQRLPHEGIVAIRLPGPLSMSHAQSLHERLDVVKREQGSNVSFLVLPGGVAIEALTDADLARLGLQRIEAVAC